LNDHLIGSAIKALHARNTMESVIQQLAKKMNISYDEFIGEMRKRGCSEPTAIKIWRGEYENFKEFSDNDLNLSNLRKAADVLKVVTGQLLPK
jgi:energy-converting hydrogenase A subunit M